MGRRSHRPAVVALPSRPSRFPPAQGPVTSRYSRVRPTGQIALHLERRPGRSAGPGHSAGARAKHSGGEGMANSSCRRVRTDRQRQWYAALRLLGAQSPYGSIGQGTSARAAPGNRPGTYNLMEHTPGVVGPFDSSPQARPEGNLIRPSDRKGGEGGGCDVCIR